MADIEIVDLILDRMLDTVTLALKTNIPTSDPTYAHTVKVGRFIGNPAKNKVTIALVGGSEKEPDYNDGIVAMRSFDRVGMYIPAREFGGEWWWRRGEANIDVYFVYGPSMPEASAASIARVVMARLMHTLRHTNVSDLTDSFQEKAYRLIPYARSYYQSGGDKEFIWRGTVLWTCLTYINTEV